MDRSGLHHGDLFLWMRGTDAPWHRKPGTQLFGRRNALIRLGVHLHQLNTWIADQTMAINPRQVEREISDETRKRAEQLGNAARTVG